MKYSAITEAMKRTIIDDLVSVQSTATIESVAEKHGLSKNQMARLLYADQLGKKYYAEAKLKAASEPSGRAPSRKKGKNGFSEDFRLYVLDCLLKNGHVYETSVQCGVSTSSIYNWLGMYRPEDYSRLVGNQSKPNIYDNDSLIKDVIADKESGMKMSEISKKYHIKKSTLSSSLAFYKRKLKWYDQGVQVGIDMEKKRISKILGSADSKKKASLVAAIQEVLD